MNHPHADELLLFASGELEEQRLVSLASHVSICATCQQELAQFERSLLALEPQPRKQRKAPERTRSVVWAGVALGAAAALALVLLKQAETSHPRPGWSPTQQWSATAGYMAGGTTLTDIDAQLTRLEQEHYYGRP